MFGTHTGRSILRRVIATAAVTTTALGFAVGHAATAGAAGVSVRPHSNLAVGLGTYAATVAAPMGTFPKVPDPAAVPTTRTATTKVASPAISGPALTFTPADVGTFVEDGVGGRLPDGFDAFEITPLVAVYPRQGLPYIKSVNLTGTTATLSQKATVAGTGLVTLITPTAPILLIAQASGSIPFIADIPTGLCLSPLFPGGVCGYSAGNLAHAATTLVPVFPNADGSLAPTAFTITEGAMDGGYGTVPGSIFTKIFDPDGEGIAPFAPFAVPSAEPGATPIGCAPGDEDRLIPNPAIGGVDYCMVSVIGLNAGRRVTLVPFMLSSFPLTWAASAGGFVSGGDLAVTGFDFANNDTIVKLILSNAKAKVLGNPLLKCPALNQTITGLVASGHGGVLTIIGNYADGCTVPSTSSTKVTIIGTKDVQQSQIPPNAVIGTNLPKKGLGLILMSAPVA